MQRGKGEEEKKLKHDHIYGTWSKYKQKEGSTLEEDIQW